MSSVITQVSIALIAFACVSGRLRGGAFTPAILFSGVGFLLGNKVLDSGFGIYLGTLNLLHQIPHRISLGGPGGDRDFTGAQRSGPKCVPGPLGGLMSGQRRNVSLWPTGGSWP